MKKGETEAIKQSGNPTGWAHEFIRDSEGNLINFVLHRPDNKFFHQTMVKGTVPLKDGSTFEFWQPMCFEHSGEKPDRVGDIVIVLRKHPTTGRFMVKCEDDVVYVTEEETKIIKRGTRSSVDNIEQAVQRRVTLTGDLYLNSRRIGGLPVKSHVVYATWSPHEAEAMIDIYEFVQSPDGPGLSALMKSFQSLDSELARDILEQVITPPVA